MQSIFNEPRLAEFLNSLKLELFDSSKIGFFEYEGWGTCNEIGVAIWRKKQTFMKRTFLTPFPRMVMTVRVGHVTKIGNPLLVSDSLESIVQTFHVIVSKTFVVLARQYFPSQFSVLQCSWCCSITNKNPQMSGTEFLIFVCDGTRKSFVKKKSNLMYV